MTLLVALSVCQIARAEPEAPSAAKVTSPTQRARPRPVAGIAHTVRSGDTLWTIARQHGVTVDSLIRANGLKAGQRLAIGQQLVIPGRVTVTDRQEPPSPAEIRLGMPPATARVTLAWPVVGPVGSPFGPRGAAWHGGIDIRAERGAAIRAAAPGMVIMSGWESGYGRVVKIWHASDLMSVYAHTHENLVRVGEWVERGQLIASVGSTGRATAPHLHFEVRLNSQKYDPLFWLPAPGILDVAVSSPGGGRDVVR